LAFTNEGGRKAANGRSASHIAYVDASDNRGAGSSIGGRLRSYCNGTRFKLKLLGRTPHRRHRGGGAQRQAAAPGRTATLRHSIPVAAAADQRPGRAPLGPATSPNGRAAAMAVPTRRRTGPGVSCSIRTAARAGLAGLPLRRRLRRSLTGRASAGPRLRLGLRAAEARPQQQAGAVSGGRSRPRESDERRAPRRRQSGAW
jgi:hypothetical protein